MVKIRNNEFNEKDIIGYLKIKDIQDKERSEKNKKISKQLGLAFDGIAALIYIGIYSFVFVMAQFGILTLLEGVKQSGLIFCSVVLWMSYAMLIMFIIQAYRRKE